MVIETIKDLDKDLIDNTENKKKHIGSPDGWFNNKRKVGDMCTTLCGLREPLEGYFHVLDEDKHCEECVMKFKSIMGFRP